MKKLIFGAILFFCFTIQTQAQNNIKAFTYNDIVVGQTYGPDKGICYFNFRSFYAITLPFNEKSLSHKDSVEIKIEGMRLNDFRWKLPTKGMEKDGTDILFRNKTLKLPEGGYWATNKYGKLELVYIGNANRKANYGYVQLIQVIKVD